MLQPMVVDVGRGQPTAGIAMLEDTVMVGDAPTSVCIP